MNSDSQEGKGGASIIPSARKSIHSNEMGRYGANSPKNKRYIPNSPASDQGEDQVDNVMSKMARQASPLTTRKKPIERRNSYSQDEDNTDEYSSVLSKSLPTTLPSRLYYSDDNDLEEINYSPASISKSRFEDSAHSMQLNRSNQSSNQSPQQRRLSVAPLPRAKAKAQPESNKILLFMLTLVVGIIAVLFITNPSVLQTQLYSKSDKSTQTVNFNEIQFENNMNNLQEKYNIDSNSILKLKSGISTIFSRMDTGSFMFVYDGQTDTFNPSRFEKFVNEVAYTAARYLRNNLSSIKHTVVLSSNLDMQEHGELISKYRDDVDKSGVLLVKEVDSVPSKLAMAFHYYCDEYDPLVKRSAIFFTLNLANCSNAQDKKSTHDFIEKCLAGKWKTVPAENMRPLLTRVVDIIIDVTSVF